MTDFAGAGATTPPSRWRAGGYAVYGLLAVSLVAVLVVELHLVGSFAVALLGIGCGILAAIGWTVLVVVAATRRFRGAWPYAVAPVLVVGVVWSLIATGLPGRLQFTASQSSLVAAATDCTSARDVRIGAFRVEEVRAVRGGCLFELPSSGLTRGVAWVPDRAEFRAVAALDEHLTGPWYRFTSPL